MLRKWTREEGDSVEDYGTLVCSLWTRSNSCYFVPLKSMYGNCLWPMEWNRREDREWSPLAGLFQGVWHTYDSEEQTLESLAQSLFWRLCNQPATQVSKTHQFALFAYISVNTLMILCCILAFVWTSSFLFLTYLFLILEVLKTGWTEEIPTRHYLTPQKAWRGHQNARPLKAPSWK